MNVFKSSLLFLALSSLLACGGSNSNSGQSEAPIVIDRAPEPVEDEVEPPEAPEGELVLSEDTCETDADCVPAGCCHAAACAAVANAPDCSDTMCTASCEFGTLDCGGSCLCHEGHCAARLSVMPDTGAVQ